MSILINLALATICFTSNGVESCYPALLGKSTPTPTGEFTVVQRMTSDPGYGGDVIQFHETPTSIYAIHRIWLLSPKQKRLERINSKKVEDRFISGGCINVMPDVYQKLLDCCMSERLIIK